MMAVDLTRSGGLIVAVMTKGTNRIAFSAGASWWRGAFVGVPAWRWPSSL
jgi:hypothetical protein